MKESSTVISDLSLTPNYELCIMNYEFNIARFGKYFTYQVKTGWRKYSTYVVGAILLIGFIIVLLSINTHDYESSYLQRMYSYGYDPMWGTEMGWFWFAIFAVSTIAASFTFGDLADKNGRIFSLMVPASQLEKYLTRWIILGPVTWVAIIVGLELVDVLRYLIVSFRFPESKIIHFLGWQLFDFTGSEWKGIIAGFIFLQSMGVLGSSIWPKNALVKTMFAWAIISFLATMFGMFLFSILDEPGMVYGRDTFLDRNNFNEENFILWCSIVVAVVNYVVAYFRYREIEIVQRW